MSLQEKMIKKMMPPIPMDRMMKNIAKKMVKDIFPIEMLVYIKIYKAKDGSFVFQFKPIEEEKKEEEKKE